MKFKTVLGICLIGFTMPLMAQNATDSDVSDNSQATAVSEISNTAEKPSLTPAEHAAQSEIGFSKVWVDRELTMDEERGIRKLFESRFPGIKVDAINISPMPGVYEVQVGLDLLYTDAAVNYVLQGSLIDAKDRRDLTAERLDVIQKVAFDSLPLENAIKQVKGTGEHVFAMFEDPNCGYCKQMHKSLEQIDNTTIYSFLFPILAPDSTTKSRDVWCADDSAKAWHDWMVNGVKPATAECETPIKANLDLGRKLKVQGTPALFFPDGTRVKGALPLEELQRMFGDS